MNQTKPPTFDLVSGTMLAALAILWGGSFFFAEIALREVSPLTIVFFRVFCAFLLSVLILTLIGERLPKDPTTWFYFAVMGALNNAIPFYLIFWGQTNIESGLAAILNSTSAFFGVIVAGIFLRDEPIQFNKVIGVLFGVAGVVVIIGFESLIAIDLRELSQLAVLAAALSYSFASVWGKRHLSSFSPATNTCGMLAGSSFLLLPVMLLTEGIPDVFLSQPTWLSLGALSLLSTAIAYLLYFSILAKAGSANLMLVTLLIPLVAIGLGVMFLDEHYGVETWIGFALIGFGLVFSDGRLLGLLRSRISG